MKQVFTSLFSALLFVVYFIFPQGTLFGQGEKFVLNPGLEGKHPRILFNQVEAEAKALLAKTYMKSEWDAFVNDCKNSGYPTNLGIIGQQQWWYFSRLGIGVALTQDPVLIKKGVEWLSICHAEDWDKALSAESTVGLDVSHKLAGFALLYDCMYNYLSDQERTTYEALLKKSLIKFKTRGYDKGDYWTNDYQNNHMHFRATATLFCSAILVDKDAEVQSYADYTLEVWRRIIHMMPPDGSNHEGLNYSNYGGQMLYPGLYGLKHCTKLDVTTTEHYRNVGYYYMHHLVPGMVSGFGFGDAGNSASASGPNYLFQIANFTQDPYIQFMAHKLRDEHMSDFFLRQWFILFNDPLLEKKDLSDVPLSHYCDDIGIAICRSDWGDDATAVAFKCGPMGGKWMNANRPYREYTPFSEYVNVAHDDPDAGTFLLFSKGEFLTTGDGYEKNAKVTTQHSTFIVDDKTQYGGGGGWSQPKSLDQYAWQKDFFDVNNRVAFSGDMKGVYPGMNKLTRTFVSQKAKYIVIYDDAESDTDGRTFEWRLQTTGTLSKTNDKLYTVQKNDSKALVEILSPQEAKWSTTENNIGNILRARLSDQKENKFLVVLWPQGANMNAIQENINTNNAIGVKILNDGNNEYTLFQKADGVDASSGDVEFNGNTLLLVQKADNSVQSASLVNGNSLKVNSIQYLSADNRINFGILSFAGDAGKIVYSVGPSFASDTVSGVKLTIGALSPSSTYYYFKDNETSGSQFSTDASGVATIQIDLDATYTITVSKQNVNISNLNDVIAEAVELHDNAVEGTDAGTYASGAKAVLNSATSTAKSIASNPDSQSSVDKAVTDLQAAIEAFTAKMNLDFSILNSLIDDANTLHDEAVEGEDEGMYAIGAKAELKKAIDLAEGLKSLQASSQDEINDAAIALIDAIALFNSKYIPKKPVTIFSEIPYFGEFNNYTPNNKLIWTVIKDQENYVLAMTEVANTSGQFSIVNDSIYTDFEISFKAKSIKGASANDIMIVFGHLTDNSYSFVKLSSQIDQSGVFMRIGGPTKFDWLYEDFETKVINDYEWNDYKMVSLNSIISVYKNNELIFEFGPDETLKYQGKVGIGTNYRNIAWFDDIKVVRLSSSGLNITDLQKAIDDALLKLSNAVEGVNIGEYETGSKGVFQEAINAAKAVIDNTGATQSDIDSALSDLETAVGIFDSKIVLGIQSELSQQIKLSPNPASNRLFIQSGLNISGYEIVNMYGKLIKNSEVQNNNAFDIRIDDLESGVYFIKLHNDANNYAIKMFVKQ